MDTNSKELRLVIHMKGERLTDKVICHQLSHTEWKQLSRKDIPLSTVATTINPQ